MSGVVDLGDVFDARHPQNMKIFKDYARANLLVLNLPERDHYNVYALAGTRFLQEFGYDAVLFYPDEFHPVHTKPHDCWLFIREDPAGPPQKDGRYYSGRVTHRQQVITGGLSMEALVHTDFIEFYVPKAGSAYAPYRPMTSKIIETSTHPEMINHPPVLTVTPEMLTKRKALGIIPSPFSNRKQVPVGTWGLGDDWHHQVGISFGGSDRKFTWGDRGTYLLPLVKEFWEE